MTRQNNYKQNCAYFEMDKRGQITIFIIIAIAIVGLIAFLFLIPGGPKLFQKGELIPTDYLSECVEDDLREAVELLAKNGGYREMDGSVSYLGDEIKYLCYSSEYFQPCSVQQPFIKNKFENELEELLRPKAEECAKSLIQEFGRRGYSISSQKTPSVNVSTIPSKIRVEFFTPMTITKEGSSQIIEKYDAELDSEMYNLLFIASSIIDFEATFGDSETTNYMAYYPDLKIEKTKLSDESTIYILTNVVTEEEFRFASRSYAWAPGYGID